MRADWFDEGGGAWRADLVVNPDDIREYRDSEIVVAVEIRVQENGNVQYTRLDNLSVVFSIGPSTQM